MQLRECVGIEQVQALKMVVTLFTCYPSPMYNERPGLTLGEREGSAARCESDAEKRNDE